MDVEDPDAKMITELLCPPERHGHVIRDVCIDPRRVGRPYRYVYGSCVAGERPCNSFDGTCRIDVATGDVLMYHDSPNAVPAGPPKFLPRPGAHPDDEADGVLLVDCLGADGRAFVVVLDGRTFTEIARVTLPYRHCASINNTWVWADAATP